MKILNTRRLAAIAVLSFVPLQIACAGDVTLDATTEQPPTTMAAPPPTTATPEAVRGTIGSSPEWQSGWIDLRTITDFPCGQKLRLRVGGTARRMLLRLLPQGSGPNGPQGVDGGPIDIPASRVVHVWLEQTHKATIQVSVHGGVNPFGLYALGERNGPVTLQSLEVIGLGTCGPRRTS